MPANDHYTPAPSELSDVERRLLALLAPLGLDFLTTRQSYFDRYGGARYHDWADTIALPPSRALSDDALTFHMYADSRLLDLPPEYLFADFMPTDDARHNHRLIEAQLSAKLGPPRVIDVSNTLGREWRFGVFRVELTTFPPELQHPHGNTLHQKEPRLVFNAGVRVHADYCLCYPDASLRAVVPLLGPALDEAARLSVSLRKTRRNPQALSRLIPANSLFAWRDAERGRFGVSACEQSLVCGLEHVIGLSLLRVRGRGGQRSSLGVRFSDGSPSLDFFDVAGDHALDSVAAALSDQWQLSISEQEADND